MGRSRIGWAAWSVAPWALAVGVLLSITAEAGQEPANYASAFDRASVLNQVDPVRRAIALGHNGGGLDADGQPRPIVQARLMVGDPIDLSDDNEIEPDRTLKTVNRPFPAVERTGKGDPFIILRPGFDARRHSGGDVAHNGAQSAEEFDPHHSMSPMRPDSPDVSPVAPPPVFTDGSTPAPPLEFALNSSSPTPNDGVVVNVELDGTAPETTIAGQSVFPDGKPNYATLIDPKDTQRQMRCLAEAIYFEARSEPEAGQAAVAEVVLNRVRSGLYPTTVCGVVYQDRNRPFACQFSFACEGKSLRIEEPGPWAVATRIADEVVSGKTFLPDVAEAVNYHATYVSPFWKGYLKRVDKIGMHIFYAMREGTAWAPGALNGHGDRP
jgi:hypothetical protein